MRSRRLEWLGLLSVVSIAVGLASALVLHDPHVLLVKDSVITGAVGLAFLVSLLASRPLTFVFARQFASGGALDLKQRWSHSPRFRARMRQMTVVWGLGMLGEATVRVVLAFLIAPATLLAISPLLAAAFLGPLAAWTLHRRRAAISAPEDSPRYRSAGDAAAQRDLPDGPRGDERDQGDRRAPQENLVDAAGDRGLVRLAQRCG